MVASGPTCDGERVAAGWFVAWPAALAPYLHGRTRVRVAGFDDGRTYVEEDLAFDGAPAGGCAWSTVTATRSP